MRINSGGQPDITPHRSRLDNDDATLKNGRDRLQSTAGHATACLGVPLLHRH